MENVMEYIHFMSKNNRLPEMDMSYHAGKGYSPLSELMRAIVLRAIEDYQSSGLLRDEAIEYLFNGEDDEDEEHIFSFPAICKHLGMDPGKTRAAIMNAEHRISTRRRAA